MRNVVKAVKIQPQKSVLKPCEVFFCSVFSLYSTASSLSACLWFSEVHHIVSSVGYPCCPSRPEWTLPLRFYLQRTKKRSVNKMLVPCKGAADNEMRVNKVWFTVLLLSEKCPDFFSPFLRCVFILRELLLCVSRNHVEYWLQESKRIL